MKAQKAEELYDVIVKQMEKDEISKYQLEKITGITQSTLGRNLSGKAPMKVSNLLLICEALGLSVSIEKNKSTSTSKEE